MYRGSEFEQMKYPLAAAALSILAVLSLSPAPEYQSPLQLRRPPTFRLSQLFATALLCRPMRCSFRVICAVLLGLSVFASEGSTTPGVALADVVLLATLGVACVAWHARGDDLGASCADALMFLAGLRTLEAALGQARRAAEFQCLEDGSGVATGTGLVLSSAAQGTLVAVGAAAALWVPGCRLLKLQTTREVVLSSAVVQAVSAAACEVCQGEIAQGIPAIFAFGSCNSVPGCSESMRARRFVAANCPIPALWLCCLATLVSSTGSRPDERRGSEPGVLLLLGAPGLLLAVLCSWSGSYAWAIEATALASAVAVYLAARGSTTVASQVYLACLIVQQAISVYESGILFVSYFTNWSRVADCILLAARVALEAFSICRRSPRPTSTLLIDTAGLSNSASLFVASQGLVKSYTGKLIHTEPADFTASVVDFPRAQLVWVSCHFISVFVWACLWHESRLGRDDRPCSSCVRWWFGVLAAVAGCWTVSVLLGSEKAPYGFADTGLFVVFGSAAFVAWAVCGLQLTDSDRVTVRRRVAPAQLYEQPSISLTCPLYQPHARQRVP